MEAALLTLSGALLAATSAAVGAMVGASRARRGALAETAPRLEALDRELRRSTARVEEAEKRGRLVGEQLRAAVMAPAADGLGATVYADRASPRELDAIAGRLRGFAFLDGVVVAGEQGIAFSRDESEASRTLAVLIARLFALEARDSEERGALADIQELTLVTRDARHVALRRLPAWTGAFLGAMSRSQAPSSLALDAAVAGAILSRPTGERRAPGQVARVGSALHGAHGIVGEDRGSSTKQLAGELTRMSSVTQARALAFGREGRIICGVFADGPPESVSSALLQRLDAFTSAAARAVRSDVMRVTVKLADGSVVLFSPLQASSRFALLAVTSGAALEPLEVDRLVGRIRRLVPAAAAERTAPAPNLVGGAS
jgi:hypothetical protein